MNTPGALAARDLTTLDDVLGSSREENFSSLTASGVMTRLVVDLLPTPLGEMVAAASENVLFLLEFGDRDRLGARLRRLCLRHGLFPVRGTVPVLERTALQLEEYFGGRRRGFDLLLDTRSTSFQRQVWSAVEEVPFGATLSYKALAGRLGRPGAVRAAGRAVGDNRLALVIPCHRVVAADGGLTGYAGHLWRKRALLDHESRLARL